VEYYATSIDKEDTAWFEDAQCKGANTEDFFIEAGQQYSKSVKEICTQCGVRGECLSFAVKYQVMGFWAGTTEKDRRQLKMAQRINRGGV
jgi:WhiB family redox-sensing transcriptional regulator